MNKTIIRVISVCVILVAIIGIFILVATFPFQITPSSIPPGVISSEISQSVKIPTEKEFLKNIKKLPDDQIDVGLASLIIAKGIYPDIDIGAYLKKLDRNGEDLRKWIGDSKDHEVILSNLNSYISLFWTDYKGAHDYDIGGAFLNQVLDKAGNCFGYTILYLALGKRLNIPLSGMLLSSPYHAFVRYNDGVHQKDIEATDGSNFNLKQFGALSKNPSITVATNKELIGIMLCTRGFLKYKKGDFEGAIVGYTQAIELNPNDARAYYARGLNKARKGNVDGAMADYTKAIEIAPNDADAYFARGLAKAKKGDNDGALADYTKAIEIDPEDADVYYARAHIKANDGDNDGALVDYTKTIVINPKDARAYYARGRLKARKSDNDGAMADWKRAIKLDPDYKKPLESYFYGKDEYLEFK